jgi:lactate permease
LLRQSIAAIADDQRIQVLLIAFSFGAFIEGAAGFGTPVAISAAMLIGLGFRPMQAASLALIGNTAPVAFGALGTPLIALARVTELPLQTLSTMVGRQLPLFSLIVPFWLIFAMSGLRGMRQVWPACLVTGLSFGVSQFLVSNYHGPWLVDVISAVASILALLALLRCWKPEPALAADLAADRLASTISPTVSQASGVRAGTSQIGPSLTGRQIASAWLPWVLLSVCVFAWGLPQIRQQLNRWGRSVVPIPGLHLQVVRDRPVVEKPTPERAEFEFNWLSATGTALLLAGLLSGKLLGLGFGQLARLFARTLQKTAVSLLTIAAMLALGFTSRYGGLDAAMGLALASTGWLFPFFSPILGWLGVALTGSDTSSNVLFGNLQQITSAQVGVPPVLAAASNSSGGVMGKMIDAQSIVVASIATDQHGQEGTILRSVFWHSVILAALVGLLVALQASWLSSMVPQHDL